MTLRDAVWRTLRETARAVLRRSSQVPPGRAPRRRSASERTPSPASDYPGDYAGMPPVSYAPVSGSRPDPGEIVWAWVPYEEDHTRGKDRPVLLVGRDGAWLLGLPLTSRDHDRDAHQEARAGRVWMDVGAGDWDPRGRASEVRLNRVIRIDPDAVRRTSVALDRARFDRVVAGMRRHLG